jgi:hypothetical protein
MSMVLVDAGVEDTCSAQADMSLLQVSEGLLVSNN